MTTTTTMTENPAPAAVYDRMFVPALFARWGLIVADAAGIARDARVLDVGCGTGALTLAVAERVGSGGTAVGLDINPGMLAVARTKPARVEWVEAPAEALPFPERSFDAVVSQFALMFFADRVAALSEMWRVLRPGGRLAVAVCDAVERSPGYAALASLLDRLFGAAVADAFRAPFALGDAGTLRQLAHEAQIPGARVTQHHGNVRFASFAALVSTERACVWTLGGLLDDVQFDRLLAAAETELHAFRGADGVVTFDMPALILTAARPAHPR